MKWEMSEIPGFQLYTEKYLNNSQLQPGHVYTNQKKKLVECVVRKTHVIQQTTSSYYTSLIL
jgi:hypothetical protein